MRSLVLATWRAVVPETHFRAVFQAHDFGSCLGNVSDALYLSSTQQKRTEDKPKRISKIASTG